MTYRRVLTAGLACAVLLLVTAPGALAQSPDGDRFLVGQNFVLESGDRVAGSLSVIGGDAVLEPESRVDGDVALVGGDLRVGGTVAGDIVVFGGSIQLDESAIIKGSVAGIGSSITRGPGAQVEGESFDSQGFTIPDKPIMPFVAPFLPETPQAPRLPSPWSIILWPLQAIGWSLFMAVAAALAVLIAPRHVGRVANTVAAQPVMSFLVGFCTVLAAALVGLVLLICCCLGLVAWLIAALAVLVGWIAVGLWVGQALLNLFGVRDISSFIEAAIGVFLITFLSRLPFCLGGLIGLLIAALGLGAVVLTRFGTQAYPQEIFPVNDFELLPAEITSRDVDIT